MTQSHVIVAYTLEEALGDGVLHLMGWAKGKPLVATNGTMHDLPNEERQGLFQRFLAWQKDVEPTLPEEDRMFVETASNQQKVWIIEDGAAITLLYPVEY
jgi:hypothetical protein